MNQQLATQQQSAELAPVNAELLTSYLDAMGLAHKLNQNEKLQFLQIAQAYGLNPFKREIYCTKYDGGGPESFSIIVGYETYIKRAERSGKLDGWETEFRGEGDNLSCVVTIFRKDWSRPFKHEVWYSECVQKKKDGTITKFWLKKRQMTRKVAISQTFRLCFSDEIGGMPYTEDEMPTVQDTTAEVMQTTQPRTPAQQMVDAVSQPADQAIAAVPVEKPAPRNLTKKELAEMTKKLTDWGNNVDVLMNDPVRRHNPEAYQVARTALIQFKAHMPIDDLKRYMKHLTDAAYGNGVDYDGTSKTFYAAEPELAE
jgi:phage recombination protein Bet